ncbi:tRNA (uracil-5-)-methyltransferase homolog B [Pleurodeles waltl]|uniref:tRNA (uracil-5-)-methyltransferase homolog B n=1 Tax=Pleurodeles waltl TaxID=8319 RepID=UPI0037097BE8
MYSPVWMRSLCQHLGHSLARKRFVSGLASDEELRRNATVCPPEPKSRKKKSRNVSALEGENSSWEERLSHAVTPLWTVGYEDQLKVKFDGQKKILQTLVSRLKEVSGEHITSPSTREDSCCPLQPVVPSPVLYGYRNKSTFSVNRGPDGDPKTVGYYLRDRSNNIICVRGDHLENIPEKHKQVSQLYEEYIKLSPLDACLLFHQGGHWREITVRTNRTGDTMAIVTFHPQDLSQEELCLQKESLKEFFTRGPGAVCNLTSLYFQESTMTRCTHEQSPYQLLHGEPHIFEELLGLKIRISPDAFFQVNTAGAEVLYKTIAELSHVSRNTVFLDVCCGTGTIGLSMANQVSEVLGIELIENAVEDAKWNASFNGISNCKFHSGKAEVVLPELLLTLQGNHPFTAVVNPSRAGLHYRVTRAIRNCRRIRTLVYVSCKPQGEAMRNLLEKYGIVNRRLKRRAGTPQEADWRARIARTLLEAVQRTRNAGTLLEAGRRTRNTGTQLEAG